jgi:voltage-gated potassium channel Kch
VLSKQDTIQTIVQGSLTFTVTPNMLEIDEMIAQTPLKYLAQVYLVLERIPTKALYKLRVSFMQEVQSRAQTDVTNLQPTNNVKEALELVVKQVKIETKEEKECVERLEHGLNSTYS